MRCFTKALLGVVAIFAAFVGSAVADFGGPPSKLQYLYFTESSQIAGNTIVFLGPLGAQSVQYVAPWVGPSSGGCTVQSISISTSAFPGAGETYTYDLFIGSTDTATSTISGASTNITSITGPYSWPQYNALYLKVNVQNGAASAYHQGAIAYTCP